MANPREAAAGPPPPPPPCRVVLVDDDPLILDLLRAMLDGSELDVRTFADPAEALASMTASPPDVLVVDWFMAAVNGPEFIRRVRAVPALVGTYCVLLTAMDREGRKVEGLEGGADDYLTKSVEKGELLARIRVGARVRRLERQAALLAMAAALGHEINNPLTAVLGFLEVAEEALRKGEAARVPEHLARVRQAAERIRDVVDRLLRLKDPRLAMYQKGSSMLDLSDPAA